MNNKLKELGIKGSGKLVANQLGEGGLDVDKAMSIWQPLPVILRHSACQVITYRSMQGSLAALCCAVLYCACCAAMLCCVDMG